MDKKGYEFNYFGELIKIKLKFMIIMPIVYVQFGVSSVDSFKKYSKVLGVEGRQSKGELSGVSNTRTSIVQLGINNWMNE